MEAFEIIATALIGLLDAVAWPLAVVIILLSFKKELVAAIRRMSHLKYKDLEASFEAGLVKAEEQAASVALPTETPRQPQPAPTKTPTPSELGYLSATREHLDEIANISPKAAILVSWPDVERAALEAAQRLGIPLSQKMGHRAMHELVARGALPAQMEAIYRQLRDLRNQAAHTPDFVLDSSEADRYLHLVSRLFSYLNKLGTDSAS